MMGIFSWQPSFQARYQFRNKWLFPSHERSEGPGSGVVITPSCSRVRHMRTLHHGIEGGSLGTAAEMVIGSGGRWGLLDSSFAALSYGSAVSHAWVLRNKSHVYQVPHGWSTHVLRDVGQSGLQKARAPWGELALLAGRRHGHQRKASARTSSSVLGRQGLTPRFGVARSGHNGHL